MATLNRPGQCQWWRTFPCALLRILSLQIYCYHYQLNSTFALLLSLRIEISISLNWVWCGEGGRGLGAMHRVFICGLGMGSLRK